MKPRRATFNPKRKVQSTPRTEDVCVFLEGLAAQVRYGGNPEHKRRPENFALTPASHPRPGKTLCDSAEIFSCEEAVELLREGIRRGLISTQYRQDWPQNIWAVAKDGTPLEAQLEAPGVYHGYPMPVEDPLRAEIIASWRRE